MRRRWSLLAGLACGVACVLGVVLYVQDAQAAMEAERSEVLARFGGEQVEVYVATCDIAAGDAVDASNSEKRLWVGELLPEGAVTDLSDLSGLPTTDAIYEGEVIVAKRFTADSAATMQVPEGMCAVSVPAKPVSAVGGSVKPGALVDVYSTSGKATDLLASGVEVLATSTSQDADASAADVAWITLAVKPSSVEELIAAASASDMYFTLPAEESEV